MLIIIGHWWIQKCQTSVVGIVGMTQTIEKICAFKNLAFQCCRANIIDRATVSAPKD